MDIKTFDAKKSYLKILLYGPSGVGKTTLAVTAPDAVVASLDKGGLLSVKDKNIKYVDIKSLANLLEFYRFIKDGKHQFKTIIIDGLTELNEFIIGDMSQEKLTQNQWGTVLYRIKDAVRRFCKLDYHVIFLAQEERELNDKGELIKIQPNLTGKAVTEILPLFDVVAYYAKGSERRVTAAEHNIIVTKDRIKLGTTKDLNIFNWIKLSQGIDSNTGEKKPDGL